jgi:hypothetical protein
MGRTRRQELQEGGIAVFAANTAYTILVLGMLSEVSRGSGD